VIATIVVSIMTLILLLRILTLWFLIVLSPIAFVTRIFPNTAKYSDQWWGEFNKQIIVGPVIAFFLWLALTIIALNGADSTNYGFKQVSKAEQSSFVQGQSGIGAGVGRSVAASITEISTNDRLLSFMITIGMLLGALQAAQQVGGAGGKIAGNWSEKIRSGGLTAAGVLSGVAAARVAARGAGIVGGRVKGTVQRKLSTFTIGKSFQPGAYFTKSFWKGYAQRGDRLQKQSEAELGGKGEEFAQRFIQGFLARSPHAVGTLREESVKGNISQSIKHFDEMVGRDPSTEKLVEAMKTARATGGKEGMFLRAGAAVRAAQSGNIDDYNQKVLGKDITLAERDTDGNITKDEKIRLMKKYQMYSGKEENVDEDWGDFTTESSTHMKALMLDYMGLNREKYDAEWMVKTGKAKDMEEAKRLSMDNARNASLDDQDRLQAYEWMSNVVLERGQHVEQRHGGYDTETGKAYVMTEQESITNIKSLVAKKGLQEIASNFTPHVIAARYLDEKTGEVGINTDAGKWNELGNYFYGLLGQMTSREFGRLAPRVAGQILGNVKYVDEKDAIFDEYGGLYDEVKRDEGETEESWNARRYQRGVQSREKWDKLVSKDAAAASKLYELHFYKATTGDPKKFAAPGINDQEQYERDLENRRRASRNAPAISEEKGQEENVTAFPVAISEEERVERTADFPARQAPILKAADRFNSASQKLPNTPSGYDEVLNGVTKEFGDFTDQLKGIAGEMKNDAAKKELGVLIDKLGKAGGAANPVNRVEFLGQSAQFQTMYFKETAELLKSVEKAIKATIKVKAPETPKSDASAGGAGGGGAEDASPKAEGGKAAGSSSSSSKSSPDAEEEFRRGQGV
jgi:hypothetical protein